MAMALFFGVLGCSPENVKEEEGERQRFATTALMGEADVWCSDKESAVEFGRAVEEETTFTRLEGARKCGKFEEETRVKVAFLGCKSVGGTFDDPREVCPAFVKNGSMPKRVYVVVFPARL